jgi:hypothetical protein
MKFAVSSSDISDKSSLVFFSYLTLDALKVVSFFDDLSFLVLISYAVKIPWS